MRSRLLVLLAAGLSTTACVSSRQGPVMIAPPVSAAPMTGTPTEPDAPPAFSEDQWHRIVLQQPWVDQAAQTNALSPNLINAVIWVESRFQPEAKSPAGARGLMQLMPATAAELARFMGKHRAAPYDPEFNVAAGSLYLKKLLDKYHGDVRLALAAYHAGAGNVDKWMAGDGLPPMSEEYVALVLDAKRRFDAWDRPTTTPADTMIAKRQLAAEPQPTPPPEPLDVVPDPPLRYDLDSVESDYVPTLEPEPPLRDTPWPPIEDEPTPKRSAPVESEDEEVDPPPTGTGEALPSVLD
jgi:hypothetical protein